jgi:hypothetical protein
LTYWHDVSRSRHAAKPYRGCVCVRECLFVCVCARVLNEAPPDTSSGSAALAIRRRQRRRDTAHQERAEEGDKVGG